jgi:hypothetical protein
MNVLTLTLPRTAGARALAVMGASAVIVAAAALFWPTRATSARPRSPVHWQRMLVTPVEAATALGGNGFRYYDRPVRAMGRSRIGPPNTDCPEASGFYDESMTGNQPANDSGNPADLFVSVYVFPTAAAAHRTFRCLHFFQHDTLTDNGALDLTDLDSPLGNESFGGGGDWQPLGVLRRGRYIAWIEVQRGYGPLRELMYDEDTLIRNYG